MASKLQIIHLLKFLYSLSLSLSEICLRKILEELVLTQWIAKNLTYIFISLCVDLLYMRLSFKVIWKLQLV